MSSPTIITREQARALGLKRYFVNTVCSHGHIAERFVVNMLCVACAKMRKKRDYLPGPPHPDAEKRKAAIAAGAGHYISSMPCKQGHVGRRKTNNHECMECAAIGQRKRAATSHGKAVRRARDAKPENRAKRRATDKEIYWSNLENERAEAVARYWSNRETILANAKAAKMRNPVRLERQRAASRQHYWDHREHRLKSQALWKKQNPDTNAHHTGKRRARKKAGAHGHTAAEALAILKAQKHKCAYCRANLRKVKKAKDHIVPLARGGTDHKSNIQWLCANCNNKKHANDPMDFARRIGLLL